MESLDAFETTMELVHELLDEPEFRDGPSSGVVLQAYLRESPAAARPADRVGAGAARAGRRSPCGW